MEKSESIVELSKAMTEFQKEVKQPFKDKNNPFFKSKYVPLESVVEAITDIAPNHGISFTQWALNDENGMVGISTLLMHESGEWIEYDPVFFPTDKQTAQGAGALMTYLKRYTLSAIFGITSDEDDDGNQASGNSKKKDDFKAITQKQVGEIKTKAKQFADLRGQEEKAVYEALKISDVTKLSESMATKTITTLNKWIEKANE